MAYSRNKLTRSCSVLFCRLKCDIPALKAYLNEKIMESSSSANEATGAVRKDA